MTPYVVDRHISSSNQNDEFKIPFASEMVQGGQMETDSVREGSIASREDSSVVSSNSKLKHTALKRVSFGSSKGSMVETVIFDNESTAPYKPITHMSPSIAAREEHIQLTPPSKVRVTFYESQKPHYVTTPDSSEFSFNLFTLASTMASSEDVQRYINMNVGVENPFRPEGELSREAESLVRQVQTGQPLESSTSQGFQNNSFNERVATQTNYANSFASSSPTTPAIVEIQHGIIVPPASPSNVEQITIKKKPKCHCCVIL